MQWTQISGILDRVVIALLTWLAAKGYIASGEIANYAALILGIAAAVWGWYVNRPKAIAQAAAELPGTVLVTTPALAAATPDQSNIVSNSSNKVVPR